jgi:hypothetical protein
MQKSAITKSLIVGSTKRDPKTFGTQKYENNACWNVEGGLAPNGVCATRWVREIKPDATKLLPLAVFLVTAGNGINVAGPMPHPLQACNVVVYNGRTEADQILWEATSSLAVNGNKYPDVDSAVDAAKKLLACYEGTLNRPQKINGWLFDIIRPDESDEDYLNRQAEKMLAVGAVRVVFNYQDWHNDANI